MEHVDRKQARGLVPGEVDSRVVHLVLTGLKLVTGAVRACHKAQPRVVRHFR